MYQMAMSAMVQRETNRDREYICIHICQDKGDTVLWGRSSLYMAVSEGLMDKVSRDLRDLRQ